MTTTQSNPCGREVEYDFGAKTGACGSETRSGTLKCHECQAAEASDSQRASVNAEPSQLHADQ